MDDPERTFFSRKPNPRENANFFSKLFFLYIFKLMKNGFRNDLEEEDLYETPKEFKSKLLCDRLEIAWKSQKKHSFVKLFCKTYAIPYLIFGLTQLIPVTLSIIRPQLIGQFVAYFDPRQKHLTKNHAWIYGSSLIILNFLDTLYYQHYLLQVVKIAIKARSAVSSFIYRQVLQANNLENISMGEIVTFMTTDVASFQAVVILFNQAWAGIVKIAVFCIILYYKIGLTSLVMLLCFAIVIPLESWFLYFASNLKVKVCKKTDERLGTVKECLGAIRIVKMYIWERFFESKINNARNQEISLLYRINFVHLASLLTLTITEHVLLFLMIMAQVWVGGTLSPATTFYIINISNALGYFLRICIPYATFHTSKLIAALGRIEGVLDKMERTKEQSLKAINKKNLILEKGLTIISGINGSGKSTLLKSFIEENNRFDRQRISYASQEPWLFPSTIRQNIVFVEEYDEKRYKEVLRICTLLYDLEQFDQGDRTIVADRAINLSKGQQARINLARAIYRKADIYLLDNFFNCLDVSVSEFIFRECLVKFLKEQKVVLVSNCTKFYEKSSCVVVLNNFEVKSCEKYVPDLQGLNSEDGSLSTIRNEENSNNEKIEYEETPLINPTKIRNIYTEVKKSGTVDLRVYSNYIKSGGGYLFFISLIIACGIGEFVASFKTKYISQWVNFEIEISKMKSVNASKYQEMLAQSTWMHYNHGALVLGLACTIYTFGILTFLMSKKASSNLHKHLTGNIVNAGMKFFDITFLGNILNRFSKDFQIIDEQTPFVLLQILKIFWELIGVFVLIALVNRMFLIPSAVLLLLLVGIRYVYLKSGRNLKRLDLATKSPVVGYLNASFEGLTTIRAFNAEDILRNEFDTHQDLYTSASFIYECSMRLFILTIDFVSMTFISIVIFRFLIIGDRVLVGTVGLAITQAMRMVTKVPWGIQQWAELETQMTSIERVLDFSELKTENRQGLELKFWPKFGSIKFENVFIKYTSFYVLKNVNFTVKPAEKFAIVGRTGAGKSSIASALFRLYAYEGGIFIDGVEIRTLSLDFLRSNIAIIPQDPVLFRGTIRTNLDPLLNYTDEEIWSVLKITQLTKKISDLSTPIDELKLSVGQRQLICLSMVLLSKNRIVVFDEAVEDVDAETELLIRSIIDKYFDYCTLITIAHKLDFIRDFDRVLVLNRGEIVEVGEPSDLLKNENGALAKLVAKTK